MACKSVFLSGGNAAPREHIRKRQGALEAMLLKGGCLRVLGGGICRLTPEPHDKTSGELIYLQECGLCHLKSPVYTSMPRQDSVSKQQNNSISVMLSAFCSAASCCLHWNGIRVSSTKFYQQGCYCVNSSVVFTLEEIKKLGVPPS